MRCSKCSYVELKKGGNSATDVQEWSPIKLPDK
jgi:hypothetical protein